MKITPIPAATLNPYFTEIQMVVGQTEKEEELFYEIKSISGSSSLSKNSI